MKIGIFGGSFNPVHIGHVLCVQYALLQGFDEIYIVPCYEHPYGKKLIHFDYRVEMCKLAFSKISGVTICDIERLLNKPSYTHQTIEALRKNRFESNRFILNDEFRLILGSDLIEDFKTWHGADIINELAPPYFIGRSGSENKGAPNVLPEVSSTQIKSLLKNDYNDLLAKQLLPTNVYNYICYYNLYK